VPPLLIQCTSGRQSCPIDNRHHGAFGEWANRANHTHRLSLLIPTLHHHAFRTINAEDLIGEDPVMLAGSMECPHALDSTLDDPLMGRSLCPWYWKINYNKNRIPAMLPEAVCRCRNAAIRANGIITYQCQPLTMHVRVLELDETCERYEEKSVEISLACVSVFQSAVRLNKISGVQHVFHPEQHQTVQDEMIK